MKELVVKREDKQLKIMIPEIEASEAVLYYTTQPEFEKNEMEKISVKSKETVIFGEELANQRFYFLMEAGAEMYVGAERRVNVASLYNCRDLGGYQTEDGRMTKWGQVFRSDALHELTASDKEYLNSMEIRTVIDFRSPKEISAHPNQLFGKQQTLNFNPHAEVARQASAQSMSKKDEEKIRQLEQLVSTSEGKEQLKKNRTIMVKQMKGLALDSNAITAYQRFFSSLLDQRNLPMIFHCQGGKDRTGWAAALFLAALGVPKETIYADYLLTEQMNAPRNQKRMDIYQSYTENSDVLAFLSSMQQTKASYLDGAFQAVEENYGDIWTYLNQVLMLEKEQLATLKDLYLY